MLMIENRTSSIYFIVLACVACLLICSCTSSDSSDIKPIKTEADFIGFITEINPSQDKSISGHISVESHADKIVSRYTITIKNETLIFRQDGDNLRKVAFTAFKLSNGYRYGFLVLF
jgi:hypothetical protein